MLKRFVKCTAAAAFAAALCGAVQAQSYVTASGGLIRTADGQCWRTGYWSSEAADKECEPPLVAKSPITFTAEIFFAFNDDHLNSAALKRLDDLGRKLVALEVEKVVAVGYADGIGSPGYNQHLSARRVAAVREYLAAKGVTQEQLTLEAKGSGEPMTGGVCDNVGLEQRLDPRLVDCLQPDRRVKVEVTGRPKPAL